jgi:hypothetical protein
MAWSIGSLRSLDGAHLSPESSPPPGSPPGVISSAVEAGAPGYAARRTPAFAAAFAPRAAALRSSSMVPWGAEVPFRLITVPCPLLFLRLTFFSYRRPPGDKRTDKRIPTHISLACGVVGMSTPAGPCGCVCWGSPQPCCSSVC